MSEVPTTIKNQKLVERRREQIIVAAIKLFSKNGFHKTSMRELAEESGLSLGNIYDYVGSKEDIFYLIHNYLAKISMEHLSQSIANISDPIEQLRRMVRAEFNLMDQWSNAIMLLYQESHILSPHYLHKLLEKERDHLKLFEVVIQDCVEKGLLRDCNVRMTVNLIKSMVDTWVIKRWDLRGHATRLEAEKAILGLVLHGMVEDGHLPNDSQLTGAFEGKNVLFVNGDNWLGMHMCAFLLKQGANLSIHLEKFDDAREVNEIAKNGFGDAKIYYESEHGALTPELIDLIENEQGPIDIFMHDLGAGNIKTDSEGRGDYEVATKLDANLKCAADTSPYVVRKMSERSAGRIIYFSPSAWDRHADRVRYETVRAGVLALTKELAKNGAHNGINVNCIVPGYIRTLRPSRLEKKLMTNITQSIPFGRMGEIEDVTDAMQYLASDASKYVTGQKIKVGGGLT